MFEKQLQSYTDWGRPLSDGRACHAIYAENQTLQSTFDLSGLSSMPAILSESTIGFEGIACGRGGIGIGRSAPVRLGSAVEHVHSEQGPAHHRKPGAVRGAARALRPSGAGGHRPFTNQGADGLQPSVSMWKKINDSGSNGPKAQSLNKVRWTDRTLTSVRFSLAREWGG